MAIPQLPVEEERFQKERLRALVALAAQPLATPLDEHPPAEELAAFGEGRLGPADRERVLAHLDACSDCYEEWLAVVNILDARPAPVQQDVSTPPAPILQVRRPLPIPDISRSHRWRRRAWIGSGAGLALAACLALVVLVPWRTDSGLPALLEGAYDTAQAGATPELRQTAARQTLPWEAPTRTYGFSATEATAATRAFATGLWEGRTLLAGAAHSTSPPAALSPPTPAAEWADYTLLGRWVILLQTVCKTPQADSPVFWDRQRAIAVALRDQLARRPVTDLQAWRAATVTQDLENVLSDVELMANRDRLCKRIERNVEALSALMTGGG
jgi:hypothetical protein